MITLSTHRIYIISILAFITSIIDTSESFAQIIDNEQAASWVQWKQIQTDNFQLIYPSEFDSAATPLARKIDSLILFSSQDFDRKPRKISIILQSNHVEQNGFAQLAPRKVEAFSTPGPGSDNTEWLPNLVLHELRHVAQFDKLTGKIKGPFLEQLALALYGVHLPAWYFEGDAVSIETQYSSGGRGRSPAWVMPFRTNLLSEKTFSFSKNILGSYKDITPSYYVTGYAMNTYLTNRFGYSIKDKIMENMRKNLGRPFNFNLALKTHTDLKSSTLFQAMTDSLKGAWKAPKKTKEVTEIRPSETPYWEQQYLPQSNGSDAIFFLQQTPQHVPTIKKLKGQRLQSIIEIGYQLTPYFHLNDRYLVWDEIRKDARFGKQTYNIIRIKDLKTGKTKSLSENSRFYSPVLSKNSKKIYVVHVDLKNRFSLFYIDRKTTQSHKLLEFPQGYQLQQPMLNQDESKMAAIVITPEGTNIVEIDLESRAWQPLFPWSNVEYQRPVYRGADLFFKANFNGRDNIFCYESSQQKISQVTDSEFGAFLPSIGLDAFLYYNSYQADGYKAVQEPLADLEMQPIDPKFWVTPTLDRRLSSTPFLQTQNTSSIIKSEPYNPLSHLFNFHSLSLSSNNFQSFDNYRPGLFWLANDLLNTSEIKLGYQYDLEMEKSIYSAALTYQRYYPKFSLSYLNRGQIGYARKENSTNEYTKYDFREHLYQFNIEVPFVLYRGRNIYSFGLNVGTSYQQRYKLSTNSLSGFHHTIAFPLNYQLYFGRNKRRSQMDLVPKWGQNLNVIYRHTPFQSNPSGRLLAFKSNFYFPGLVANHGLQARFSWQESAGRYQLSQDIPMVSGYAHFDSPVVSNTLLFHYHFPIAYPDWSIGSLTYIKRFRGYLFADYQNLHNSTLAPISFGLGLSADFNMFRYVLPDFGAGVKLSYVNHPSARKVVPSFSLNYSY